MTDYFAAEKAITEILASLPDEELPELNVKVEGGYRAVGDFDGLVVRTLGACTLDGKPVVGNFRRDGVENVLVMEAIHRAELRWWDGVLDQPISGPVTHTCNRCGVSWTAPVLACSECDGGAE